MHLFIYAFVCACVRSGVCRAGEHTDQVWCTPGPGWDRLCSILRHRSSRPLGSLTATQPVRVTKPTQSHLGRLGEPPGRYPRKSRKQRCRKPETSQTLGYQAHRHPLALSIYLPVTSLGVAITVGLRWSAGRSGIEPQPRKQHGSRALRACRSRARPGQRLPPCMRSGGTSSSLGHQSQARARSMSSGCHLCRWRRWTLVAALSFRASSGHERSGECAGSSQMVAGRWDPTLAALRDTDSLRARGGACSSDEGGFSGRGVRRLS